MPEYARLLTSAEAKKSRMLSTYSQEERSRIGSMRTCTFHYLDAELIRSNHRDALRRQAIARERIAREDAQ